ncbi:hypothetical protein KUTeg_014183 [Tegillarca granosa]|uniref:Crossover junction endonuclease MUS81 n=1 Tax=Tegillarca granosa TaxID=220873 RepID=A0ABQ9EVV9_TEGGR|nr:hypothetical protein KUTeg_014183 [Tegillarca granosa]
MNSHPLYGKRKKRVAKCPNPLFAKWLTEWKEDAVVKNIKTQYVYGKVHSDKICKMLDDKLNEYISINGADALTSQLDTDDDLPPVKKASKVKLKEPSTSTAQQRTCHTISDSDSDTGQDELPVVKQPPKAKAKTNTDIPAPVNQRTCHLISDSDNDDDENDIATNSPPRKRQRSGRKSGDKEYIPMYRSGPYALLLALYKNMQSPDSRGFMTKAELLRVAQPLADKSFTIVSSIVYCLTDAGCELAHKLEHVQENSPNTSQTCNNNPVAPDRVPPLPDIPRKIIDPITSGLEFSYVSEDGNEVRYKDRAAVLIDGLPLGDEVYAYIHNDDAPELAIRNDEPDLPSLEVKKTTTAASNLPDLAKDLDSQANRKPENKNKPPKKTIAKPGNKVAAANSGPQLLPLIDSLPEPPPLQNFMSSVSDSQDSQNSIQSISSTSSSIKSLPDPDFILSPGIFEIVLCIDNQEFYGASKLQVGDILWVAQEKTSAVQGQLVKPQARELVLDYIIERKRMDDLVHSCTDGRLPDQKFRLKHCGLRRPIFLIEDYGSMQHFSMPEERLRQTITNLKVIDGFEVKRTKDSKETVAYLTVMTRYLQSFFRVNLNHSSI